MRTAIMTAVLVILVAGTAQAGGDKQAAMFWEDHPKAAKQILTTWSGGGSRLALARDFKNLLRIESGLLAYGVDFNDARLYSREFQGLPPTDIGGFVYRVLLKDFRRLDAVPEPAEATFSGRRYAVSSSDGGRPVEIRY